MAINFLEPETFLRSSRSDKLSGNLSSIPVSSKLKTEINSSKDVSGIELRMLPPLIKDNHTPAFFPFPGYSKLYCLTIVVSDATNQLAGLIDLKGFPRIGDQENLPINKTIFYWQKAGKKESAPNQIHTMCSVIKSKKDLRDTANILAGLKDDNDYQSVVSTLGKVAKDAAKINVVTDILVQVGGIVGKYLGAVEDKPLGTVINSYTTLHGDFDKIGINTMLYPTKDVDFKFEMVVRNRKAEELIASEINATNLNLRGKPKFNLAMEEEDVEVDMQPL